jgi:hypothetical protein
MDGRLLNAYLGDLQIKYVSIGLQWIKLPS